MTETPIILTQPYVPFELDLADFSGHEMLGYDGNVPVTKLQMWDRLAFVLSMAGLIMMPNNIRNVREERNRIIFSLSDNTRFTVAYERKISFDKHLEESVDVYDWFDIKSGSKLDLEEINDHENDLVKKILFYDSVRKGNSGKGRKDLVSISFVKKNNLLDYEQSESFVRLKTIQMMKDEGLRGRPNGYNKYGKPLHYAINLEHTHREVIRQYKPKYTIQEIFEQVKHKKEIWNLTKKLLHRKQISILRESSRLPVDVLI